MHAQLSIITPNSNETKLTRDPRNGTASTSTPIETNNTQPRTLSLDRFNLNKGPNLLHLMSPSHFQRLT